MQKRLYRSRKEKIIAGVCGGLSEYFEMDPVLVRVVFVVLAVAGGAGVLTYIILWLIVPEQNGSANVNPAEIIEEAKKSFSDMDEEKKRKGSIIGGLVLLAMGGIFLADNFIPGINFSDFWPVILIVIGIGLLWNAMRKP